MVSIIIPVYNTQSRLKGCFDSILSQTYEDIEVIAIDDGSTDSSFEILKDYQSRDNRVKVYHQDNHGVSYTRNYGLSVAEGEYIAFVDSDDQIEETYIERLMEPMEEEKLDLVLCGYKERREGRAEEIVHNLSESQYDALSGKFSDDIYLLRAFIGSPWMKLYKSQLIKANHIRFSEDMITGEDQVFNFQYFMHLKKYKFINKPEYIYIREKESLSQCSSIEAFESDVKVLHAKKKFLEFINGRMKEKIYGEGVHYIVHKYVVTKDDHSLKGFLQRAKRIDSKRTFAILENKKSTIILLLYRLHMEWLYYFIATGRRGAKIR